jgi:hypothetical protein
VRFPLTVLFHFQPRVIVVKGIDNEPVPIDSEHVAFTDFVFALVEFKADSVYLALNLFPVSKTGCAL